MWVTYEDCRFTWNRTSIFRWILRQRIKRLILPGMGVGRSDEVLHFLNFLLPQIGDFTFWDIGANQGTICLPLARRFPSQPFTAVEPFPEACALLIRNVRLNRLDNVKAFSVAVAETDSIAQIHTCPENFGGHRMQGFAGRQDVSRVAMASVGVAAVRLDKLLATSSGTDLMRQLVLKVDVEGLESQVLMSLGAEFEPQKTPIIVCEFGSEGLRAAMSSPELLLKMALDRGYCCLNITDGLWVSNSLELPPFRNYIVKNFVFIHANLMEVVDSFVRLRTDNQFSADRSDLMQVPRS